MFAFLCIDDSAVIYTMRGANDATPKVGQVAHTSVAIVSQGGWKDDCYKHTVREENAIVDFIWLRSHLV